MEILDHVPDGVDIEIDAGTEDLLRFSRPARRYTRDISHRLYRDFRNRTSAYARAIIHNIGQTELQIRLTIQRYTRRLDWGLSRADRLARLAAMMRNEPEKFAEDLMYLEQRSFDLDAQVVGLNLLIGKPHTKEIENHRIYPLLQRCFSPFREQFESKQSSLVLPDLRGFVIATDFRLFNCAMFHFFENAQKYIKPGFSVVGDVDLPLQQITFVMTSRAIDDDEKEKIRKEGFSGRHAAGQKGEGLGLAIIDSVLTQLGAELAITWIGQTRLGLQGVMYQENTFTFTFPGSIGVEKPPKIA